MMIHSLPVAGKLPLRTLATTNKESQRGKGSQIQHVTNTFIPSGVSVMVVTIAIFVSTFLVSSEIIFIVGFLCGGCFSVEKLEGAFKVAKSFSQQAAQLPCMN